MTNKDINIEGAIHEAIEALQDVILQVKPSNASNKYYGIEHIDLYSAEQALTKLQAVLDQTPCTHIGSHTMPLVEFIDKITKEVG